MDKNKKYEDEIKFGEIPKKPIRLFGWVFIYFFLILFIAGLFYIKNLDKIFYNASPQLVADTIGVVDEVPMTKGGMRPAVDLALLMDPGDDLVARGKELYSANCSSCHGAEGKGDGAAGAALNPKPRNFLDPEGWTNGNTFSGFYKTLQEGIIQNGMAAYEYLPAEDRVAIIQYVRTLGQFPAVTEAEVTELDGKYQLSKGTMIPNTIPVSLAVEKIINEFNAEMAHSDIYVNLETLSGDPGAELFRKYSINGHELLKSLKRSGVGENLDEFILAVSASPVELGFKPEILRIKKEEWKALHDYVGKIVNFKSS